MTVRLTVVKSPSQRFVFEAPLVAVDRADAMRRLVEAEIALNELTGLRVHVEVDEEGER